MKPDPKPTTEKDEEYLIWLITQPCCVEFHHTHQGDIIAAHQTIDGRGHMAGKGPGLHALPLCFWHHQLEHSVGIKTFWGDTDRKKLIIDHLVRYIRTLK